jgi:hypothetical protein
MNAKEARALADSKVKEIDDNHIEIVAKHINRIAFSGKHEYFTDMCLSANVIKYFKDLDYKVNKVDGRDGYETIKISWN